MCNVVYDLPTSQAHTSMLQWLATYVSKAYACPSCGEAELILLWQHILENDGRWSLRHLQYAAMLLCKHQSL